MVDRHETTGEATWLLVADRRRARLLSAEPTSHGRLHIEEVAAVEEDWEEFQHGRPSARAGKDGHSYASRGHEDEERLHRFAKQVSGWLAHEVSRRAIPALHAFSARQLLGELRRVLEKRVHERVEEHALDLAHLSPGELARHKSVLEACGPGRAAAGQPSPEPQEKESNHVQDR